MVQTIAFRGINTTSVEVQTHIANELPTDAIVGLADTALVESHERMRATLLSIGLALPQKRIEENFAPADIWCDVGSNFRGAGLLGDAVAGVKWVLLFDCINGHCRNINIRQSLDFPNSCW